MAKMRLDKFLTEMGEGSRSQVKELIRKGRVLVNGRAVKQSETKLDPDQDQVQVDGRAISYVSKEYYLLNKPKGVVSATEDSLHPTVVGLLTHAKRSDLFPVGRLDMDTEGLLLLTNDGDLAHRLLSPKKHVDKTYYAELSGTLPKDSKERMAVGLVLEDGTKTLPARLTVLEAGGGDGAKTDGSQAGEVEAGGADRGGMAQERPARVFLTIQEGKFHQVKRMFEVLGCRVTYLKRTAMGPLTLDETLAPGQYRPLTREELEKLQGA